MNSLAVKGADFSLSMLNLSPIDPLHDWPSSQLKPLAGGSPRKTKRVASLIEKCVSSAAPLATLLLSRLAIGPVRFASVLLYFRVNGKHRELWSVQKSTLPVKVKCVGAIPEPVRALLSLAINICFDLICGTVYFVQYFQSSVREE